MFSWKMASLKRYEHPKSKSLAAPLRGPGHAVETFEVLIYPGNIRETSEQLADIPTSHGLLGGHAMARRPSALIPRFAVQPNNKRPEP
jgi:hypothetical protein